MTSLTIKLVVNDDGQKVRRKGEHLQIVPPRQRLACFHCGYWLSPYPHASYDGISSRVYQAILQAFAADHRRCKPAPEGRETYIQLKTEWDKFMETHKEEREEWEKDHERKWSSSDWGAKYDGWINLPYKKKEREKHDTSQPGAAEGSGV